MSAAPLIAGRLYRVRGWGRSIDVIAINGADAIDIAAERLHP
jgi:hypothetical protein